VKKGGKAVPQVLVKWTGLPQEAATWEDWYVLLRTMCGSRTGGWSLPCVMSD
jgi:hypothetical protein